MNRKKSKDPAASIRQRLLNLARANKEDFLFTLTRFGIERLMYRLSESKYANTFEEEIAVLKRYPLLYDYLYTQDFSPGLNQAPE